MAQSRSTRKKQDIQQPAKRRNPAAATTVKPVASDSGLYTNNKPKTPKPVKLTIEPAIKQTASWQLTVPSVKLWFRNWQTSLTIFILPLAGILAGGVLAGDLKHITTQTAVGLLLISFSILWLVINVPASYYLQLSVVQGRQPNVWECYRLGYKHVFRLIGLIGLVTAITIGGLLVFIVPGIIFIRRYILAPYYLMDQDLGIREAMRRSAADSKPVSLDIWGVFGVYIAINLLANLFVGQLFKPYGSLVAGFITSLYAFGPALRYKEVALRQPAIQGLFEIDADN